MGVECALHDASRKGHPREPRDGGLVANPDEREPINLLTHMPSVERLALPSLQPQRADIVVHGIAILLACMLELDLPAITVSEYGNLEGYLKVKYLYNGHL